MQFIETFSDAFISQTKNILSIFFSFSKLRVNFEDFIKKMTLTVDVFLNLRSPKYVVREMSKRSSFRGLFEHGHAKRFETLWKSER